MITILIVEDHPVVCIGLEAIIASQPDMKLLGQAANGRDAVRLAIEHSPDVILLDLRLPDIGGVEVIRKVSSAGCSSRFLVLTSFDGDEDIYQALKAGAQSYLLKGMPHSELLSAIRAMHAGKKYIPEPVSKRLSDRSPCSELTAREHEILELIVNGCSNKQIAQKLDITEGTVKWHVNVLLSRLNVSDRTQAAVCALKRGLVKLK